MIIRWGGPSSREVLAAFLEGQEMGNADIMSDGMSLTCNGSIVATRESMRLLFTRVPLCRRDLVKTQEKLLRECLSRYGIEVLLLPN